FIKQEMASLGWAVEEDAFDDSTPYGVKTFSNVIATFNPTVAKRIVVACHYDSKLFPDYSPFVGATDSALPCAVMLDSARRLQQMAVDAQTNQLNDFSLQYIFFDGEEALVRWSSQDSLYGSRHLAQRWASSPDVNDPAARNNLQNIELFVLLDLIGTSDTRIVNHFHNTASYFNTLASMEQCLQESGLLTSTLRGTIFQRYARYSPVQDDHIPFLQRGVPILHLISTPFPSVWHTSQDDLQHLDPDTVDDFTRIFRLFMATLLIGL
ncbi:glutaminyl-peptide cyclotransferase, partial [Plakobranchus ocellatus]